MQNAIIRGTMKADLRSVPASKHRTHKTSASWRSPTPCLHCSQVVHSKTAGSTALCPAVVTAPEVRVIAHRNHHSNLAQHPSPAVRLVCSEDWLLSCLVRRERAAGSSCPAGLRQYSPRPPGAAPPSSVLSPERNHLLYSPRYTGASTAAAAAATAAATAARRRLWRLEAHGLGGARKRREGAGRARSRTRE